MRVPQSRSSTTRCLVTFHPHDDPCSANRTRLVHSRRATPLEDHAAYRVVEWRLARRVWSVPVIPGVPLHLCASPARPGCRMAGRFDLIHGVPSTGCRTEIYQVFSFGRVNISRPRWRVAGWRRVHWCWKSSRYVSSELFYLPVVAEVTIQADSVYCGRFMLSPS